MCYHQRDGDCTRLSVDTTLNVKLVIIDYTDYLRPNSDSSSRHVTRTYSQVCNTERNHCATKPSINVTNQSIASACILLITCGVN